jgi:RNA polymerase sigma factor (sigma-70 family)
VAVDRVSEVIAQLRKSTTGQGGGLTDGQLLEAFLARQDPAAFAALVRRHGPMVLGVCRRIVGDRHEAEDAFQATFLILVRKAAAVSPREAVGNWLYGVAYRTALKARGARARRRTKERPIEGLLHLLVQPEEARVELGPLLDEALNRLPEKFRLPVLLCDLEGRTRREVARQLHLPDGTLSNRLAAGRRMLARLLARRGVSLSAGAVGLLLAGEAAAGLPGGLAAAAGRAAAGVASPAVLSLMKGVLTAMFLSRLKTVAAAFLVTSLLGVAAAGGALGRPAADDFPAAQPRAASRDRASSDKEIQRLKEELVEVRDLAVRLDRQVHDATDRLKAKADELERLRLQVERLRNENQLLKKQLDDLKRPANAPPREPSRVQVRVVAPAGMKLWVADGQGRFTEEPTAEAPGRFKLQSGQVYRLRLADIPNRPGLRCYPTLELVKGDAAAESFARNSAIPIELTEDDFDRVASGVLVTRVVYLPTADGGPNTKGGGAAELRTLVSYRLAEQDVVEEARRRGTILAVVRLGNIDPEQPRRPKP